MHEVTVGNTESQYGKQLKKLWETAKVKFVFTDLWEIAEETLTVDGDLPLWEEEKHPITGMDTCKNDGYRPSKAPKCLKNISV